MAGFGTWIRGAVGGLIGLLLIGCWGAGTALAAGWVKTYGGTLDERVSDLRASGSEQVLAGGSQLIDGDFMFDKAWIAKLGSDGRVLWQKSFLGPWSDSFLSVQPSADGFVAAGSTFILPGRGLDGWVVQFGPAGALGWQKALGGQGRDLFTAIRGALGGYVLAGETSSARQGFRDAWVVVLDGAGNLQWQKAYGREDGTAGFRDIQAVSDGYIAVGGTRAFAPQESSTDGWVVKLDLAGNIQWQLALGSQADGESFNAVLPSESGYLLVGGHSSAVDFNEDGWAVMVDLAGNLLWQKTFGTEKREVFSAAASTGDGYAVAGRMEFDGWLVKLDGDGNILWQKAFGGERTDTFSTVLAASGGLMVAGDTETFGVAESDIRHGFNAWVLRLDSQGNTAGCSLGMPADAFAATRDDAAAQFPVTVAEVAAAPLDTAAAAVETRASMTTECAEVNPKSLLLPPGWLKWKDLLRRPGFPFRY